MISRSDFIQRTMYLEGQPWRFTDRPYIFYFINSQCKRTLVMSSRQAEKSTMLSGIHLSEACMNSYHSSLYVTPTHKQMEIYSRKKIDDILLASPLLKNNFHPGRKGIMNVKDKYLRNYSDMHFRSTFHSPDSIRGVTAELILFDEYQDIDADFVPVIETCSQHKPRKKFFYTGTPKTCDNTLYLSWEQTNQCHWFIKCRSCSHWNQLGEDNMIMDKPGIWCEKCRRLINTLDGIWVAAKPDVKDFLGIHLQYMMLPSQYIDFDELFRNKRTYSAARFSNEVLGLPYDYGVKPLTREQLIALCEESRPMWEEPPAKLKNHAYYAGIDWGMGNETTGSSGYTFLTICWHDRIAEKLRIVYCKRFGGSENDPKYIKEFIVKKCREFNVRMVGADYGFGWGQNEEINERLGDPPRLARIRHEYIKDFMAWDKKQRTYRTNRTEVMTDLFNKLTNGDVVPFRWEEFSQYGKDYLAISKDFSDKTGKMIYTHALPDDGFHSLLYAYLMYLGCNNNERITTFDPRGDKND